MEVDKFTQNVTCDTAIDGLPSVVTLKGQANLPDMSGFEVLRSLRVSKVKTPILILSGLAGIEAKVKGLGFGADDYMTKPFHKDELVARIHAIVRRSQGQAQSVIQTADLVVNLDAKTVEIEQASVRLTVKEYELLELLCRQQSRPKRSRIDPILRSWPCHF